MTGPGRRACGTCRAARHVLWPVLTLLCCACAVPVPVPVRCLRLCCACATGTPEDWDPAQGLGPQQLADMERDYEQQLQRRRNSQDVPRDKWITPLLDWEVRVTGWGSVGCCAHTSARAAAPRIQLTTVARVGGACLAPPFPCVDMMLLPGSLNARQPGQCRQLMDHLARPGSHSSAQLCASCGPLMRGAVVNLCLF